MGLTARPSASPPLASQWLRAASTSPPSTRSSSMACPGEQRASFACPAPCLLDAPCLPPHCRSVESFVHRSGRTGRAGRAGTAAVIVGPRDLPAIAALERDLSFSFTLRALPSAAAALAAAGGGAPDAATMRLRARQADAFARRLAAVPDELVQALAIDRCVCGGSEAAGQVTLPWPVEPPFVLFPLQRPAQRRASPAAARSRRRHPGAPRARAHAAGGQ